MQSDDYKKVLAEMHGNSSWGASTGIPKLAAETIMKYDISSMLDFGSGKGRVTKSFQNTFPLVDVLNYEPSDPNAEMPIEVDMMFSKDVLEHVEPDQLEYTLYDLHNRTKKVHFHLIACHKAHHFLPDGRNAHLIIETPDWWQRKLRKLGYKILEEKVWGEIKKPAGKESIAVCKYEVVLKGRE